MEVAMPSRRHSSAMLSSPRRPSSTMRILSSAENWRRVARRISLRAASAGSLAGPDVCFIFAPDGYHEPDILRSRQPSICLKGADAGHPNQVWAMDITYGPMARGFVDLAAVVDCSAVGSSPGGC